MVNDGILNVLELVAELADVSDRDNSSACRSVTSCLRVTGCEETATCSGIECAGWIPSAPSCVAEFVLVI
jgi:hypothetical protein